MKKGIRLLGLALLLSCAAPADQLYIRNRPFKGHVSAVGKNLAGIRIGLEDLAQALSLKITEVNGNWVLHRPEETPALPAEWEGVTGKLLVGGKEVAWTEEGGLKWVALQECCTALGARLSHNPAMQSVDLNLAGPSVVATDSSGSGHRPTVDPYVPVSQYRLVNFGAPW